MSFKFRNPFFADGTKLEPVQEFHQLAFSENALPSQIDAIVIGSGIGGLATAAILAKTGRRVVVLEKNAKAGGCCSSFLENGYEWDVGLHYVGKMGRDDFERFVLDQLTEGQLDWQKMNNDVHNVILVKRGECCMVCVTCSPDKVTTIPIWSDRQRFEDELIHRYPKHVDGLRQWFDHLMPTLSSFNFFAAVKMLPIKLVNVAAKLRLDKLMTHFFTNFHDKTAKSQLDRLFQGDGEQERELRTVLGHFSLSYDVEPSRAGSGLLGCSYDYVTGGAYYPIGGSNEIPNSLIPVIEKEGGRVFVNANVTEIMVTKTGEAIGVRVADGSTNTGSTVEIKAPIIISDAGVSNTFRRLLPRSVAMETKIGQLLESGRIKPSRALFVTFVGLKGSQDELKLPDKNFWISYEDDLDTAMHDWCKLSFETAVSKAKIPFLFASFPSAKDPTYNQRHPGRSVCTLITTAPFDWFRKWDQEPNWNRNDDYQAAKMQLANRCWDLIVEIYPQLADRKDFIDAMSPLSAANYLNAYEGAPYGLDSDTHRFAPEVAAALRPRLPEIRNLYLTGQDIFTVGFIGCLYSAILTCQSILKQNGECSNLFEDLKQLFTKKMNQTTKLDEDDETCEILAAAINED